MFKEELKEKLTRIEVDPSSYSLGSIRHGECICVVNEGDAWKVYYVERSTPEEMTKTSTEESAYDYVYEFFCKWTGIQQK